MVRQYDIIVFGSTGYTGQFVDEELYRIQGEGKKSLKWAAAGRSQSKLDTSLKGSLYPGTAFAAFNIWGCSTYSCCASIRIIAEESLKGGGGVTQSGSEAKPDVTSYAATL